MSAKTEVSRVSRAPVYYVLVGAFYIFVLVSLPLILSAAGCTRLG